MTSFVRKVQLKVDELWLQLIGKIYGSRLVSRMVTNHFHRLYYSTDQRTWWNTTWLGVPILKCPFDLWIYQEILHRVQPDAIVECGTYDGGSALYLAHLCDFLQKGKVLSIDVDRHPNLPEHPRVSYLTGSSTADETLAEVRSFIEGCESVLVILDSDHSRDHVLNELRLYADFVTLNSYMIVEDSNVSGHPIRPLYGPGPMEAIRTFMAETSAFVIDREQEKFYLSFNPSGYLRKVV